MEDTQGESAQFHLWEKEDNIPSEGRGVVCHMEENRMSFR